MQKLFFAILGLLALIAILILSFLNKTVYEGGNETIAEITPTSISHAFLHTAWDYFLPYIRQNTLPPGTIRTNETTYNITGGGPKKAWTEYKTWEELSNNPEAYTQYNKEKIKVMNNFTLDWSDVQKVLDPKVKDTREWAGLINIIDGKPQVIELVPSPLKIGEGCSPGVHAMVPMETMALLVHRPAMFTFHTHPIMPDGQPGVLPSDIDIISSLLQGLYGWGLAHIMYSGAAIALYGPNAMAQKRVLESPYPGWRSLAIIFDVFTALTGRRSYTSTPGLFHLWELENILRRYGVFLYTISLNSIIMPQAFYHLAYRSYPRTDPEISKMAQELEELEQQIAKEEAKKEDLPTLFDA